MKKKTYKANSVVMFIGADIEFNILSTGGSTFITDDEEKQKIIEGSRLFELGDIKVIGEVDAEAHEDKTESASEEPGVTAEAETHESEGILKVTGITSCADAREYLAERGVKTALNTRDRIIAAAKSLDIVFPDL